MEHLKSIKSCLISRVYDQMNNLDEVDAEELGEAIDMIKDISEAMYYCKVVEAMEGGNDHNIQAQVMPSGNIVINR